MIISVSLNTNDATRKGITNIQTGPGHTVLTQAGLPFKSLGYILLPFTPADAQRYSTDFSGVALGLTTGAVSRAYPSGLFPSVRAAGMDPDVIHQ